MWDPACAVCVLVEGGERKKAVEGRTAKLSCVLLYYHRTVVHVQMTQGGTFCITIMDICTAANFCVQREVNSENPAFFSSLGFVLLVCSLVFRTAGR